MANCTLCQELDGVPTGINSAYGELIIDFENIIFKTDDLFVVPSLGALSIGHILLCPIRHIHSFRQLAMPDIYKFIERLRNRLSSILDQDIVVFEHSNGLDAQCRSACVDHAHLHFVPSKKNFSNLIQVPMINANRFFDLGRTDLAYTYLMDADGSEYVLHENESQYLRKVWCAANGGQTWNWRLDHNINEVRATIKELSTTFKTIDDRA